ncbi:MAG: glutathione S-transferase family protein [Sphingomicrobium sp.]
MIIYGSTLSPFVRKVVAVAGEKGLEFELQPTGFPGHGPEFLEASPLKKMPAIRDGTFTLADSSAIIHYLDCKYPEPALIPADPEERGRAIWFDEFADTVLIACGAKIFFNRIVAPLFMGREGDEAAAAKAEAEELPLILAYVERVAPDPGDFLVTDRLTIADIAIAMPFANLRQAARSLDEGDYPRAFAFADSILSRLSIAPWLERERAILDKASA